MPTLEEILKLAATISKTIPDKDVQDRLDEYLTPLPNRDSKPLVPGLPPVPPQPGMFEAPPSVVGGQDLGKLVYELLKRYPSLTGKVESIGYAPTASVFHTLSQEGLPSDRFSETTLMGQTDPTKGKAIIYLNPRLQKQGPEEPSATLAHELSHVAGWGDNPDAYLAGDLMSRLIGINQKPIQSKVTK